MMLNFLFSLKKMNPTEIFLKFITLLFVLKIKTEIRFLAQYFSMVPYEKRFYTKMINVRERIFSRGKS